MTVGDRLNGSSEWLVQGMNLSREGGYVGAIQAFNQTLQPDSDNAAALGHQCVVRYRTSDKRGAIADC